MHTNWRPSPHALLNGTKRFTKHVITFSERSDFWIKRSNAYALLPPSTYFIGDVHSALSSRLRCQLTEGAYTNGDQIYIAGERCSERAFSGSNEYLYETASGYMGIITSNLVSKECNGTYHTFKAPVLVTIDEKSIRVFSDGFILTIDARTRAPVQLS